DVRDIYELRRLIELSAIDAAEHQGKAVDLGALEEALVAGERAARAGDWLAVGAENLRFHACVVAAPGGPRRGAVFRGLLVETRLGFLLIPDPQTLHHPFLSRNRAIFERLASGDLHEARESLEGYLDDAERQIVAAISGE